MSAMLQEYPAIGTALKYAIMTGKPFLFYFPTMDEMERFEQTFMALCPVEISDVLRIGRSGVIYWRSEPIASPTHLSPDGLRGQGKPVIMEFDAYLQLLFGPQRNAEILGLLSCTNSCHYYRYEKQDVPVVFAEQAYKQRQRRLI